MERSQPTSSLSASAPSWPPSAVNSLDALDRLVLSNRGALYEGDIFSILKRSLFVIRSFEFALADGAIDCSGGCSPDTSFADRFWDVDQELLLNPTSKKLVLFDVKSKVSQSAGDQIYSTTVGQRHHVAFYIGICAADLSFVELFPNYHQKHSAAVTADALDTDSRHVGVNSSRVSKLPPSTYILDPCNAPYRMPIRYLVEAIERVRRCVQSGEIYVNPWTKVSFPEWKPLTTGLTEMLKPSESSEHFTAYNATLEIYRFFKGQSMKLDFVGLQPRLADFKLLAARLPNLAGHHSHNHSQIFVQHKLDARDRALDSKLTKVAIARGQGDDCRYYFSDIDRFDFLFYQFSFSNRPYPQPIVEFFFIPEREIPNVFYETNAIEESFEYPHFAKYRTRMDKNGKWIRHILQIIQDNPRPRQTVPRPSRLTALSKIPDAVPSEPELRIIRSPAAPGPTDQKTQSGRALYKDSMTRGHRQFYFNIMMECAKRGSGLLSPLATDHPMGDYVFSRYRWREQEQSDFLNSTRPVSSPPKTLDHLPNVTPVVPIYYYARDRECGSAGPNLTAAQFRRLNSCSNNRLIIWNLWGPDEISRPLPLFAIPSEDLSNTRSARAVCERACRKED